MNPEPKHGQFGIVFSVFAIPARYCAFCGKWFLFVATCPQGHSLVPEREKRK